MKIGVIGGSGLYHMEALKGVTEEAVSTPFGDPSDAYMRGTLGSNEIFFLPRHGKGHRLMPSEINHRANIYGFKTLGVERVISVSAVGSLREELHPRDIVLPDQYFDRTKHALSHTFFGGGVVAHVSFGEPSCPDLRQTMAQAINDVMADPDRDISTSLTVGGTYVNMEGPAFSTKAESFFYRKQGFDIIGMTSLPEAKLCREAELCYQSMAMITDYDCWHESEDDVTVEKVIEHLVANTLLAKAVLSNLLPSLGPGKCGCHTALKDALLTQKDAVSAEARVRLAPIVGKYL